MLPADAKIISVDDHIIEPPHLWQDRLPAKYRSRGPRIERREDGDHWIYAGESTPVSKLSVVAGTDPEDWQEGTTSFDVVRPGCYDSAARIKDMDADGIWAQLCFPHYPRFAGHRFLKGDDRDLAYACIRVWNDFVLDEWCAVAPDRFIPLSIVPMWDIDLTVAEIERVAAKGSRAIAFSEDPTMLGLPSVFTEHWDPMVAALADADMVLCMHIGSSANLVKREMSPPEAPDIAWAPLVGVNSMFAAVDWVFSGMLQRHPNIRIALSEGGAGWAPYVMERMDYVWDFRKFYTGVDVDNRPSDLFRKHFGLCFLKDDVAVANRDMIGIESLMFESDFPHAESVFPHSRKFLEESLRDIPDDEAQLIVEGNARRWFRFPA